MSSWSVEILRPDEVALKYSHSKMPLLLYVEHGYYSEEDQVRLCKGDNLSVVGVQVEKCAVVEYRVGTYQKMKIMNLPLSHGRQVRRVPQSYTKYATVRNLIEVFPRFAKVTYEPHLKPGFVVFRTGEVIELIRIEDEGEHGGDGIALLVCRLQSTHKEFRLHMEYRGDFIELQDNNHYTLKEIVNYKMPIPIQFVDDEVSDATEHDVFSNRYTPKLTETFEQKILFCKRFYNKTTNPQCDGHSDFICIPVEHATINLKMRFHKNSKSLLKSATKNQKACLTEELSLLDHHKIIAVNRIAQVHSVLQHGIAASHSQDSRCDTTCSSSDSRSSVGSDAGQDISRNGMILSRATPPLRADCRPMHANRPVTNKRYLMCTPPPIPIKSGDADGPDTNEGCYVSPPHPVPIEQVCASSKRKPPTLPAVLKKTLPAVQEHARSPINNGNYSSSEDSDGYQKVATWTGMYLYCSTAFASKWEEFIQMLFPIAKQVFIIILILSGFLI